VRLKGGVASVVEGTGEAAYRDIAEIALPAEPNHAQQIRLSFWQDGLPVQSVPPQGYLDIPAVDTDNWAP
jgi:hypothetical protein